MKKTWSAPFLLAQLIAVMGLLFGISGPANAGPFAGTQLQLENFYQGIVSPGTLANFTVPASGTIEFAWGAVWHRPAPLIVTVTDTGTNTAKVSFAETLPTNGNYGASPNLVVFFAITPTIPTFVNVTLDRSTSAGFLDPARVQFTGTTFSYDFGGLPIVNGGYIQLDIATAAPVPEPSNMLLLGVGLAGLAGYRSLTSRT